MLVRLVSDLEAVKSTTLPAMKPYQYRPILRAYDRGTFLTKAFILVTMVPIMLVQQILAAGMILLLALLPLYGLYTLLA